MKIYVTGGNGFLGHHLLPKLVELGYGVIAPRSTEVNLMDLESINNFLSAAQPDAIIHLAAFYGGLGINIAEPANLFYRNTIMAANIFEAAAQNEIKYIVSCGSACAYNGNLVGSMKEEDFWSGRCHESIEAYGFTKRVQLVAQLAYYKQYGIDSVQLCPTNMYGEHDDFSEYRSHVPAALIKKFTTAKQKNHDSVTCWGDGSPVREFIYAGDLAKCISQIVAHKYVDVESPINIGTGIGTTIKELSEIIAETVEFKGEIIWDTDKPNGVPYKVLDITKLKEIINIPLTPLKEGMKKTIDWYCKNL